MAAPKRIRVKKNLTLNPELVRKLLQIGEAPPERETNLSRLVDRAIAEYVRKNWQSEMSDAVATPKRRR